MNLIHLLENSYTKHSCDNLIKMFEENIKLAKPGKAGFEDLDNLEMTLKISPTDKWGFWGLGKTIQLSIDNFIREYPLFDIGLERWHLDENVQLCRFQPGCHYQKIHCENTGMKDHQDRVFAWMLYLNDIEEGGETEFIYQNFKTTPKAGNFYIWPAGPTHMHRGVVAPKEKKYFLTGWFKYFNQ
jgi:prolyl 4-hydroxylase